MIYQTSWTFFIKKLYPGVQYLTEQNISNSFLHQKPRESQIQSVGKYDQTLDKRHEEQDGEQDIYKPVFFTHTREEMWYSLYNFAAPSGCGLGILERI